MNTLCNNIVGSIVLAVVASTIAFNVTPGGVAVAVAAAVMTYSLVGASSLVVASLLSVKRSI